MNTKRHHAQVISTGSFIEVYKLDNGNWCNLRDCNTEYSTEDIKILQTIEDEIEVEHCNECRHYL